MRHEQTPARGSRLALPRVFIPIVASACLAACSPGAQPPAVLRTYSAETADGLLATMGVTIDDAMAAEGKASLRVTASRAAVFPLYRFDLRDAGPGLLVCDAEVRLSRLEGAAYLEIMCTVEGKGTFFSRGLDTAVGTPAEWVRTRARIHLREGEIPRELQVNLVLTGPGTAWVDNVRIATSNRPTSTTRG
jgi:hypothetical protein